MDQKPSFSYPLQFAILIGLMGIFIVISAVVAQVLGSVMMHVPLSEVVTAMNKPENADFTRLLNTAASLLTFFCPALLLARIIGRRPFRHLGFNTKFNLKQLVTIVALTFAAMVLGGALGQLNEMIPLPGSLYTKAKQLEETYKVATLSMARMYSPADYIIALLVLAAIPALCEEVMFRGALQPIMTGWTKSKWAGIIITSILFSIFHFSYFGFLPRTVLGIVLGLVYYNSRNIWLSVFIHFINNAFIVTQLYIAGNSGKPIDKTMDESMPVWWGVIAIVLLIVFFRAFDRETKKLLAKSNTNVAAENSVVS